MLSKNEFLILNSLYNGSKGRAFSESNLLLRNAKKDRDAYRRLLAQGLVSEANGSITEKGLRALEPYRVDNAVILAAGASTGCIPLSLEIPKGLFEVRGERLIERQIYQLQEAGISDITIVVGYKKEMFNYLKEKYGVKLIVNPSFGIKRNVESLYLARSEFRNTYMCVCDSYYPDNPFNQYEYESFSTSVPMQVKAGEMYAHLLSSGQISELFDNPVGKELALLGHCFWNEAFSKVFFDIIENERSSGKFDSLFWEWVLAEKLQELPPIFLYRYTEDAIQEFDSFEELRQFDERYKSYAHSTILKNIKLVFRCDEEDIVNFRNVSEGMTNTSFIFAINGVDYIYRHPGDGTESIINRRNEKTSLIKAKEYGFDPSYVYMDLNEGWKISEFVHDFREPDYSSWEDSARVTQTLRELHSSGIQVEYGMRPWEDALETEKLIKAQAPSLFEPYEDLKKRIGKIYNSVKDDGVQRCFCHGDTYKPNWMLKSNGETYLIDWEYSGMSDPGIDVGYYIVDAMYETEDAKRFIRLYLGDCFTPELERHYLAYTAIIAYYWFVWALYRELCGADMGEAKENWRFMADRYAG